MKNRDMPDHHFEKSLPYSAEKGCPSGYHKRGEYTTEAGTYVPPRCVRSTTRYKQSSKEFKRHQELKQTRRLRMRIPSIKSLTRSTCPPGYIPRRAYVRRYSTAVRKRGFTVRRSGGRTYRVYPKSKNTMVESRCIKDLGLPGKGPRSGKGIGPLRKGELARHGYSYRDSEAQRHAALKKAVDEYGALGVYRKLNAVAKLTIRTVPAVSSVLKKDREWVKRTMGPLKAF